MKAKFVPFLVLAYGLYSVFTLQRDFDHIGRLIFSLALMGPAFIFLTLAPAFLDSRDPNSHLFRYRKWISFVSESATLNITQYILMFCLPFFAVKESWVYLVINVALLGMTLWDPIYSRLIRHPSFRHLLQAWTLISAYSFLFPFILPSYIRFFYPIMALTVIIAFIPTQRERRYLTSQGILCAVTIAFVLLPPLPMRFPLLSVWLKSPRFAIDRGDSHQFNEKLPKQPLWTELRKELANDASLCCMAPVVAPPSLREKLTQEWLLDGKVLEEAHLKTAIQGNSRELAFRSFYCKKNFPAISEDETLRCRVYLQDSVYIGGISQSLRP